LRNITRMPLHATIVLARHGKPDWDQKTPIPGHALAEWVRGRDAAPIDPSLPPPAELVRIARSSRVLAASTLRRSLESAALVAPGVAPQVNPLFREVFLPTNFHSSLRLRPKVWTSLARSAWYSGWSPGVESFAEARHRASLAATVLIELASAHESVLLVGHGLMDGLIGRRLRRSGWKGPRLRPRRLWAFDVFERIDR
jgi:broad specificity phosphatase PhoE